MNTDPFLRTLLDEVQRSAQVYLQAPPSITFMYPRMEEKIVLNASAIQNIPPLSSPSSNSSDHHEAIKMIFVDGGSAALLSSPGFCCAKIRLAARIYHSGDTQERKLFAFFLIIKGDGSVQYLAAEDSSSKSVSENGDGLKDNLTDPSTDFHPDLLSSFQQSALPSSSATVDENLSRIRRLQEWSFIDWLQTKYPSYTIVYDGSLDTESVIENAFLARWRDRGTLVIALSKSSQLLTDDGHGVLDLVAQVLPRAASYLADPSRQLIFARFHEKSPFVFRIDVLLGTAISTSQKIADLIPLLSRLRDFSRDPLFIGYPYPLLEVDQMARLSNEEVSYYRSLLASRIDLSSFESALSAHRVLDRSRF